MLERIRGTIESEDQWEACSKQNSVAEMASSDEVPSEFSALPTGERLEMSDADGIDQGLIKALAHPLRVRILRILGERVASPIEMSKDLDEPLGNISYHVKVLKEAEAVEEVRNEPRRGAVEHFYKATPRSSFRVEDWQDVPPAFRQGVAGASFASLVPQVVAALEANTFEDREDSSISWQPLSLDERGWREVVEILKGVSGQLKVVAKKSRGRLNDKDGVSVIAVFGAFEVAPREAGGR